MLRKLTILFTILCLAVACAPKKQETAVDHFMEKWQRLAEHAEGHSPTPPESKGDREDVQFKETKLERTIVQKERNLPNGAISLKLYNTPLPVLLTALGRSVDQPVLISPSITGVASINVSNQRWDQVFRGVLANNGLTYDWEGKILRIITMEDMQKDIAIEALRNKRRQESIVKQRVEPLHTSIIHISYADAVKLKENLSGLLTKEQDGNIRGAVDVNEFTNSVLVRATALDMERIRNLIKVLDKPRKQVRLQAHIIEATKDTARELGTQWGGFFLDKDFQGQGGGMGDTPDLGPGIADRGLVTDMTSFFSKTENTSLGLILGDVAGNYLELQLKALEEENKVNIISSPSIITLDNQLAFTESGERVPYESSSDNQGINVQFQDAVLRLEITPHIIDHETLKLKVLIKKDEVDAVRNVRGNPYIIKKHTETTLIIRNNETVVITGLSKSRDGKARQGIPYVSDIPGIGRMFAGQDDTTHFEEYLIFIRPTILPKWKANERPANLKEIEEKMAEELAKRLAEKDNDSSTPDTATSQ